MRLMLVIPCWSDNLNLIKYLVEHGLYINKKDSDDWTPLLTACQKGHEEIVKYLAILIKVK